MSQLIMIMSSQGINNRQCIMHIKHLEHNKHITERLIQINNNKHNIMVIITNITKILVSN